MTEATFILTVFTTSTTWAAVVPSPRLFVLWTAWPLALLFRRKLEHCNYSSWQHHTDINKTANHHKTRHNYKQHNNTKSLFISNLLVKNYRNTLLLWPYNTFFTHHIIVHHITVFINTNHKADSINQLICSKTCQSICNSHIALRQSACTSDKWQQGPCI